MLQMEPVLPCTEDSDEEWLESLCKKPVLPRPPVIVDTDSDDEFLLELLTPPPANVPSTVLMLGGSEHTNGLAPNGLAPNGRALPRSSDAAARAIFAHSTQPPRKRRTLQHEAREVACIGDPGEMADQHGTLMAGIDLDDRIRHAGILVCFRRNTFSATHHAMTRLADNLCERIMSLVEQRGICIFKIGITRDPYYRMFNPSFGYTQRGELYDRMDLLVASYPSVCACLERLCIQKLKMRPGCRNDAPGGENPPASGLCYLYLVTLACGDGRPIPTR